ncbi:MAG: VCBS repeat-containing protein [Planctomycetes bacterium]|nr:VCBS repeat-containing protein [Planctomycetota bacterium]
MHVSRTKTLIGTVAIGVLPAGALADVAWHDAIDVVARIPDVRSPRALVVADLDGDQDPDIIAASERAPKLVWYENGGASAPGWSTRTIHAGEDERRAPATAVVVTDLDGDRLPDVIVALNGIRWFKNDGSAPPAWTAHAIFDPEDGDGVTAIAAADVDGDGDTDLLSASPTTHAIRWHRNDGSAGSGVPWPVEEIAADAKGVTAVTAVDFDGDRDIDLLAAETGSARVRLFTNEGGAAPTWTATIVSDRVLGVHGVWAADVDGDGMQDVITAGGRDHALAWHVRTDEGLFTPHAIAVKDPGPWTVTPVDMDGDGDLDFVTGIRDALRPASGAPLRWYEHDGANPPRFTMHAIPDVVPATSSAQSVVVHDLNGNGAPDLITAWKVGSIITVHHGRPATRTAQEE